METLACQATGGVCCNTPELIFLKCCTKHLFGLMFFRQNLFLSSLLACVSFNVKHLDYFKLFNDHMLSS